MKDNEQKVIASHLDPTHLGNGLILQRVLLRLSDRAKFHSMAREIFSGICQAKGTELPAFIGEDVPPDGTCNKTNDPKVVQFSCVQNAENPIYNFDCTAVSASGKFDCTQEYADCTFKAGRHDCEKDFACKAFVYECSDFRCGTKTEKFDCAQKLDFMCNSSFHCRSSFTCSSEHVFLCFTENECEAQFTCKAHGDKGGYPYNPPDGSGDSPGDFFCGADNQPVVGDKFSCGTKFDCSGKDQFVCYSKFNKAECTPTKFTCTQGHYTVPPPSG